MLMRNLDPSNGLCNGTRMLIVKMGRRFLETKIITGDKRGQVVLISRISLDYDDKELPFHLAKTAVSSQISFRTDHQQEPRSVLGIGRYRSLRRRLWPRPAVCSALSSS
jgi:ATP-dependent DNA helicase PIF1